MKALVKENEQSPLCMVDLPAPEITDDEVLVKVLFAGVCGTDLHIGQRVQCQFPRRLRS